MAKVNGQKFTVLKDKKTVVTRAGLWKVPHNSSDDEIYLKLGRYKKPKDWMEPEVAELDNPKSELTLTGDEFSNLIAFIQDSYEPFKNGTKAFIPLDNPYDISVAHQVKQLLSLGDRERMLNFLLDNEVIPGDVEIGLAHAKRSRAIDEFNSMLELDLTENNWQKWFEINSWVLGTDFVKVLDERTIRPEASDSV